MVGTIDDIIAIRLDEEGPNDDRIAFFIIVIIGELIPISIKNMTPCFIGEINENPDPTQSDRHVVQLTSYNEAAETRISSVNITTYF